MIVARVRRTVNERRLLQPGARVLVGCSGGPDSAALLAVLARLADELSLHLHAASVDHGLRPDARLDVELARAQAESLGVAFTAVDVRVEPGPSIQAQARKARYAALQKLAAQQGADRIAVGHSLDDQAETVLMRILRGASVSGLSGVEPLRADGVVRPLIDCRRADIHRFAADCFADIAVDPSNENISFQRIRVRHGLLDAMRAEDPAIDEHLAALADDARDIRVHIEAQSAQLYGRCLGEAETLAIPVLLAAPRVLRRGALRVWVREVTGRDPGRAQIIELEGLLRGRGQVLLGCGWTAGGDSELLRLQPAGAASPVGGLDAGPADAKVVKD